MFQNNASNFIVYPSNLYKKDIWGFFFCSIHWYHSIFVAWAYKPWTGKFSLQVTVLLTHHKLIEWIYKSIDISQLKEHCVQKGYKAGLKMEGRNTRKLMTFIEAKRVLPCHGPKLAQY